MANLSLALSIRQNFMIAQVDVLKKIENSINIMIQLA